jgi:RNA polymerase sigma factor (sigma-70 family)
MSQQVTTLVDHFFREEYGKVVSFLTAKFGAQHLELAEDSVQETLYKAVKTWSHSSIPKNPSGWMVTVAANKMIDHLRRSNRLEGEAAIIHEPSDDKEVNLDSIQDDVVKMIFACCHPSLSVEYQIILILKILGGLSIKEIARALIKKEETIAKSYTRAKKKFQQEKINLELPAQVEINNRLKTVLHIIYLLFNEGYKTTSGNELIKKDLCNEAIRLNKILLENEGCNTSYSNALLALMYFHSARFGSRVGTNGRLLTLEFQDRSNWDKSNIAEALKYLRLATKGSFLNGYYIQATISGLHCEAERYEDTKWSEILELYDVLMRLNPSPIVKLNRIVALSKARSAEEALSELRKLESNKSIIEHYLFYAIKGDCLLTIGKLAQGKKTILKAAELANNSLEKAYLLSKIQS